MILCKELSFHFYFFRESFGFSGCAWAIDFLILHCPVATLVSHSCVLIHINVMDLILRQANQVGNTGHA